MTRALHIGRSAIARLWLTDKPLTAVGLVMLAALAAAGLGLWLDPRTITGAPAWLKPAKFAASIAIYTFTLAWVFSYLPGWPRMRRTVSRVTAVVMVLEFAIIALQAWRGTTSHFNVSTPLDGALFTIMGTAIVAQTITSIAVAVAVWRQRFADVALGRAIRAGIIITIVGAFAGGLMTRPTDAQLAAARATQQMPVVGAHTVGAPDGGPGLPVSGWSREHGDLRVAHFVGLHALQILPLIVVALRRRVSSETVRARLAVVAAGSYAGIFVVLLSQALRGVPLLSPDAVTIGALAIWAGATVIAAGVAWAGGRTKWTRWSQPSMAA